VARLDLTHFVTFLTESDADGADIFMERVRTAISKAPFARNLNGSGIYARAWGGYVGWQPEYTTPAAYVAAAMEALERSRPEYRAADAYFAGSPIQQAS
jgi:PleD family two-component response regulator